MPYMRRMIAAALVVCVAALGIPAPSHAALLATDTVAAASPRDRIAGFLDRAEVRAEMEKLGVNRADAEARVAALTDAEAQELAGRLDQLPAGGILGAIVLVFLVLLVTDILGLTKVFPFTKPMR